MRGGKSFIFFIYALCLAEYKYPSKKYSVLKSSEDRVYMQFDKYNIFRSIEYAILFDVIILQECAPSEFAKTFSESIQEIADRQISNITESSLIYQKQVKY